MMNKIALLMCVILLTSCAKEVNRYTIDGSQRIEKGTESCSKGAGYCYACGLGFNGKFECGIGFKYNCPGSRPVTRKVWDVMIEYDNGDHMTITNSSVQSVDGQCH